MLTGGNVPAARQAARSIRSNSISTSHMVVAFAMVFIASGQGGLFLVAHDDVENDRTGILDRFSPMKHPMLGIR